MSEVGSRRRALGQNLLADASVLGDLRVVPGELVVDLGAGRGALTVALAAAGARVLAVEVDPLFVRDLRAAARPFGDRVRVVEVDLRRLRLPREPYRVVANLPFNRTTDALGLLLDDPARGPTSADLLVQLEVARKRATTPPTSLRSAAWAPWWTFELGRLVPRRAFRPVPSVDGAVLRIRRRDPPLLPERLARGFADLLRDAW